jgi:hypothetical protein
VERAPRSQRILTKGNVDAAVIEDIYNFVKKINKMTSEEIAEF